MIVSRAGVQPEWMVGIRSAKLTEQIEGARQVRTLLSRDTSPPIDEVIGTGLVTRFVELLWVQSVQLQTEITWIITNLATGTTTQTNAVVQAGAIPVLIRVLHDATDDCLIEQTVWALSNIAGDCLKFRNVVLREGVLEPLLRLVQESWCQPVLRTAVWALSNLARGRSPSPRLIASLPMLATILAESPDLEILVDATWTFAYLTQASDEWIEVIVQTPTVIRRLAELLAHTENRIVVAALRAVGNIVSGSDAHTEVHTQDAPRERDA